MATFLPLINFFLCRVVRVQCWEFSIISQEGKIANGRMVQDSIFFFYFEKKNSDFWEHLLLRVCVFLKENEIVCLNLQWTKESISSDSSANFGNCLFSRASGQAVGWFHLKKTSCSLKHIFSHIEETTVIFIVLGFCLFAFITFDSYFKWYIWHDKALVFWGIQWVIITAIIF